MLFRSMEYLESQNDLEVDPHETNPGRMVVRFLDVGRPVEDESGSRRRSRVSRVDFDEDSEYSEVEEVVDHERSRLRDAMHTTEEVRRGIDEIEQGMNTMRIKPDTRRGLRDISNRG